MRGYTFPVARFVLMEIANAEGGRALLLRIVDQVTTAERWDVKPDSTLNVAFTYAGLVRMGLPDAALLSFPVEFLQGMKARAPILEDSGNSAPERWDAVWLESQVHVWVAIYGNSAAVSARDWWCADPIRAGRGGAA